MQINNQETEEVKLQTLSYSLRIKYNLFLQFNIEDGHVK